MPFRAPYFSKDNLRQRAEEFLGEQNPSRTIPVPIEYIVEANFGMDIVPIPGLQTTFDIVAFISKDMREIRVDEYVYENRINRYRFSLAHELAHRILHSGLWTEIEFEGIDSWKRALAVSISDKEYGFIEYHANYFAGLVLVPPTELKEKFGECVTLAVDNGFDIKDESTGVQDYIASFIAKHFEVSPDVIRRRLNADDLWLTA